MIIPTADFLQLYLKYVKDGYNTKEIAGLILKVDLEDLEDKHISYISQRVFHIRKAVKTKYPELTREDIVKIIPSPNRSSKKTDIIDKLVSEFKAKQTVSKPKRFK